MILKFLVLLFVSLLGLAASAGTSGQSVFDQLFYSPSEEKYFLPTDNSQESAFAQLVSEIQSTLIADGKAHGLMFPLGRSLQRYIGVAESRSLNELSLRSALRPVATGKVPWSFEGLLEIPQMEEYLKGFFTSPRLVVGFEGEPRLQRSGVLSSTMQRYLEKPLPLVDKRLFVALIPESRTLEVISYSDIAGRFEFQVVKGFGSSDPKVFSPPRENCLVCHQNQAPIFASGPWLESNANNPRVVKLFNQFLPVGAVQAKKYHGLKIKVSDQPAQTLLRIAKNHTNRFATYQSLWRRSCPTSRCKAAAIVQMLRKGIGLSYESGLPEWEAAKGLSTVPAELRPRDPFLRRAGGFSWEDYQDLSIAEFLNFLLPQDPTNAQVKRPRRVLSPEETTAKIMIDGFVEDFFVTQDWRALSEIIVGQDSESQVGGEISKCKVSKKTKGLLIDCRSGDLASILVSEFLQLSDDQLKSFDDFLAINKETAAFDFMPRTFDGAFFFVDRGLIQQLHLQPVASEDGHFFVSTSVVDLDDLLGKVQDQLADHPELGSQRVLSRRFVLSLLAETLNGKGLVTTPEIKEFLRQFRLENIIFSGAPVREKGMEALGNLPADDDLMLANFRQCALCHSPHVIEGPPKFVADDPEQLRNNLAFCAPRILQRIRLVPGSEESPETAIGLVAMPPELSIVEETRSEMVGYIESLIRQKFVDPIEADSYIEKVVSGRIPVPSCLPSNMSE